MNSYWPGQPVLTHAEFRDKTDTLVDPTSVTVYVRPPDSGPLVSATPTHVSTGIYEYVIDTLNGTPGEWNYRFEGSGALVGVMEKTFRLRKSLTV